jgi:hypothetical protein
MDLRPTEDRVHRLIDGISDRGLVGHVVTTIERVVHGIQLGLAGCADSVDQRMHKFRKQLGVGHPDDASLLQYTENYESVPVLEELAVDKQLEAILIRFEADPKVTVVIMGTDHYEYAEVRGRIVSMAVCSAPSSSAVGSRVPLLTSVLIMMIRHPGRTGAGTMTSTTAAIRAGFTAHGSRIFGK